LRRFDTNDKNEQQRQTDDAQRRRQRSQQNAARLAALDFFDRLEEGIEGDGGSFLRPRPAGRD
jgi:hypothetical protein